MFGGMGQTNVKNLGNGGTMDGDVTITGDLTVSGGIGLSLSEVIQGTSTIDVTNTEAFLVRKNGDGGDVFVVDTTNGDVTVQNSGNAFLNITSTGGGARMKLTGQANETTNGILFYENADVRGQINYNHADQKMEFKTGDSNTLALTIDSSQNVGIGTSSPSQALEINKSGANLKVVSDDNVYLSLDTTQTNGDEWQIFNANSGSTSTLQFKNIDQSKVVMLLDENGKVGIGTSSPSSLLSIKGQDPTFTIESNRDNVSSSEILGQIDFRTNEDSFSGEPATSARIKVLENNYAATTMSFHTSTNPDDSLNTAMTINSSGNIGIGDSSPDFKLDVETTANSDVTVANFQSAIDANGEHSIIRVGHSSKAAYMGLLLNSADTAYFGIDDNPDDGNGIYVNESGQIGIGTKAPSHALTVAGEVKFTLGGSAIAVFNTVGGDGAMYITDSDGATKVNIDTEGDSYFNGGNVGIGVSVPEAQLNIAKAGSSDNATFYIDTFSSGINNQSVIGLRKSNSNSVGTETTVEDDEKLGKIAWYGGETDGYDEAASIHAEVDGTPGSNDTDMPGALVFGTTADGTGSSAERMRITSTGNVGIGTDSPSKLLHLKSSTSNEPTILIENNNDDQHPPRLQFLKDVSADAESDSDFLGQVAFRGQDSGDALHTYASIYGLSTDVTAGEEDGELRFEVTKAGTDANVALSLDANSRISLSNNDSGTSNTIFGKDAGDSDGAGDQNVFVGELAGGTGTQTDAADGNTGVGYNSLTALTTGSQNTSVGSYNSDDITEGSYNTSVGRSSLASLTVGSHNTVMGRATFGVSVHDESYNVAIGNSALGSAKQDGTASSTNREVKKNVAIGYEALVGGTLTGTNHLEGCVAIGANAMDATGANNQIGTVAIGQSALGALTSGTDNVGVGYKSLFACNTGTQNTALGTHALYGTDDGTSNTAIGAYAMHVGNAGTSNTAVGAQSMIDVTGSYNTAVGMQSLFDMTSGGSNVALGALAMKDAHAGESHNIAIGVETMRDVDEDTNNADYNIAIGSMALLGGTVGGDFLGNIAIGYHALDATGANAHTGTIAIGYSALGALTSGGSNTAIGYESQLYQTDGANNTTLGYKALRNADNGESLNTALGTKAGEFINHASSDGNTIVGTQAMVGGTGARTYNTAMGYRAMGSGNTQNNIGAEENVFIGAFSGNGTWTGDTSNYNTAIGAYTMDAALDGALYNVAVGYQALSAHTEGDYNTVLGAQAGLDSTTGAINTLIGFRAGYDIIGGAENTFIGSSAGQLTTAVVGATLIGREAGGGGIITTAANHTTAVGYQALYSLTSGAANVAIGAYALDAITTSANNTAVGYNALTACGDSYSNVAIGKDAGDTITNSGGLNTVIGTSADVSTGAAENQIAIGYGTTAVANNSVTLGNSAVTAVYMASDSGALVHTAGIQFPASQAASGGANVLDDYEEGDWTPVLSDGSNNATSAANTEGTYTKIGRQVTVVGRIATSSLGSVSGGIQINGLPFAAGNDDKYKSVGNIGLGLNLNVTAGYNIDGYIAANSSSLFLYINDVATGGSAMTGAEWSADGHAIIQATYFV